jgi:hypothetical protein
MASRRSQIVDAIVTALSAATATDIYSGATYTKPASLDVFRTHPAALKAGDLPAICVRLAQEEATKPNTYKARRALAVRVDCLVGAADDGETVEDALDALTSWAVQAIGNTATLHGGTGALAHATTEVITKWEESDTDAVYGRAAIGFSVDYITAAGNPDSA